MKKQQGNAADPIGKFKVMDTGHMDHLGEYRGVFHPNKEEQKQLKKDATEYKAKIKAARAAEKKKK